MAEKTPRGDSQLGWIYEGTKALVNREDYLLGKRVDKNFEMYSDAVVKEKETPMEAIVEGSRQRTIEQPAKFSNLGVNIVRNEDPLVAIKVKEEKLRQEKLENPLMMLKIQKVLKEAMEKKARKMQKKMEKRERKAKRERKHLKAASSDDDNDNNEKHSRERATSSSHKHRHHKKKHHSKESESDGMKRRRRHSSNGNISPAKVTRHRRRRHSTKNSSSDENNTKTTKDDADRPSTSSDFTDKNKASYLNSLKSKTSSSTKRSHQFDSHIPEHLRPKREYDSSSSSSESDSVHRKSDKADNGDINHQYGLIDKKRRSSDSKDAQGSKASNPYELIRFKPTIEPYKKEERRKLTPEEMEMKRLEMIRNAEWRNSTRSKNIAKARKNEEEELKDEHSKPADFIRPMLNDAAASMSVERQLNSHRLGLQRSHGYMEQKFANR
ncbi:unnamed protein product [Anisakis simplex]|uniref:Pre-mRNA-splicing factor CWC25 homolog n=1 Tax=Anisakis simplex TaxID=6269 RepID=A0A0M3JYY2_ANISI|nr:unnamed protein product [Anisakis simplex]